MRGVCTPLYPPFLSISGGNFAAVFDKKRGKRGVLPPHFTPLLLPCCSCILIGPLPGRADFGVILWGGSHSIRQNSDAGQWNDPNARVVLAYRPPAGSESVPKGLPEGCISAPTARRFFLQNSPKGLPSGSKCAPMARHACGGYGRRCAELIRAGSMPSRIGMAIS